MVKNRCLSLLDAIKGELFRLSLTFRCFNTRRFERVSWPTPYHSLSVNRWVVSVKYMLLITCTEIPPLGFASFISAIVSKSIHTFVHHSENLTSLTVVFTSTSSIRNLLITDTLMFLPVSTVSLDDLKSFLSSASTLNQSVALWYKVGYLVLVSLSQFFREFSRFLGVQHLHTTNYHPTCNRIIERFHLQLKPAFRASSDPLRWAEYLPILLLRCRSSVKADRGYSSAELIYSTSLSLPR